MSSTTRLFIVTSSFVSVLFCLYLVVCAASYYFPSISTDPFHLKMFFSTLSACVLFTFVYGDYGGCPSEVSESNCSLMADCAVCNQGSDDALSLSGSYVGCSECTSGYFLYRHNQCESCNGLFGNECLHCTDTTGCQQCSNGFTRTYDSECGLYYCEETAACDEHCSNCQSNNNPPRCAQCSSGYFLGDGSGQNGCLSCFEEYGSECLHCADLQGCQQCDAGYNRVKDPSTNLWYCECYGDHCITIIDFEELAVKYLAGTVSNGYGGLNWIQDYSSVWFSIHPLAPFYPGMQYLVNNNLWGNYGFATNLQEGSATFGLTGGPQFKLVEFEAIMSSGSGITITCNAFRDGVFEYAFSESGLSDSAVTTISMGNNVIIDVLTCTDSSTSLLLMDNFQIVFV